MDKTIYEFFDRWAAYFQKHHGWNLLAVRVYCRGGILVASTGFFLMARSMQSTPVVWTIFMVLNGGLCWLQLHGSIKLFERCGDYPENKLKCDILNILTVIEREQNGNVRIALLVLCAALAPLALYKPDIAGVFWGIWVAISMSFNYIECCLYLGPGEHSKELNKKLAADALPQRSEG